MAENSTDLMKTINPQIQGAQQTQSTGNTITYWLPKTKETVWDTVQWVKDMLNTKAITFKIHKNSFQKWARNKEYFRSKEFITRKTAIQEI